MTKMLGKAIGQAMTKACNHQQAKLREKPVKIAVITPDRSNAMSTDIKNANNKFEYLALIRMI